MIAVGHTIPRLLSGMPRLLLPPNSIIPRSASADSVSSAPAVPLRRGVVEQNPGWASSADEAQDRAQGRC